MMAGRGGKAIPAFLCSLPTIIFLYHVLPRRLDDGARDMQILDGGSADDAERAAVVLFAVVGIVR